MEKNILYEMKALYRDSFRVMGYKFGQGKKSACILGNIRGNEVQQLYVCSQLIRRLKEMEAAGKIMEGHQIMVIPSANPYSMNIAKRFWPTDNTDINRMFPGYAIGETTQRIAAGIFQAVQDYQFGIQLSSFYMPGNFTPHVRMMKTGFEDVELAKKFGMPYVVVRNPRPYDTTTLNYNWQIWETHAFSLYTTTTVNIDKESAAMAVHSILIFLSKMGVVEYHGHEGYISHVVEDTDMVSVRTKVSGIFEPMVKVGEEVLKGQTLANIMDPYEGEIKEILKAPVDGIVFFAHNEPLTYADTAVFKLIFKAE